MTVLAANPLGGNLIMAAYLLVAMVALVFGFFTVRGSGITNHPYNGRDGTPGSRLPDEFTQFADRQVHDHDLREAEIERRIDERLALTIPLEQVQPRPQPVAVADMSVDDVNQALAAEAALRKEAKGLEGERAEAESESTPR
jgi:hypothetical protein